VGKCLERVKAAPQVLEGAFSVNAFIWWYLGPLQLAANACRGLAGSRYERLPMRWPKANNKRAQICSQGGVTRRSNAGSACISPRIPSIDIGQRVCVHKRRVQCTCTTHRHAQSRETKEQFASCIMQGGGRQWHVQVPNAARATSTNPNPNWRSKHRQREVRATKYVHITASCSSARVASA
jgi:hypothetical protein